MEKSGKLRTIFRSLSNSFKEQVDTARRVLLSLSLKDLVLAEVDRDRVDADRVRVRARKSLIGAGVRKVGRLLSFFLAELDRPLYDPKFMLCADPAGCFGSYFVAGGAQPTRIFQRVKSKSKDNNNNTHIIWAILYLHITSCVMSIA